MSTRRIPPEESGAEVNQADKPAWQRICERLRQRASFARWTSYITISFVLAVLAIGCWAIWEADRIAPFRFGISPKTGNGYIDSWYLETSDNGDSGTKPAYEDELKIELQALRDLQQSQREELKELTKKVEDLRFSLKKQIAEVRQKVEKIADIPRLEREHWKNLVMTFATRFGLAAVLLLLVRILVSIYRYHARLAAFYDSKADALELAPTGDVVAFEKLCAAITPSAIDFQESADSIAEHAVEIAKKITPGKDT